MGSGLYHQSIFGAQNLTQMARDNSKVDLMLESKVNMFSSARAIKE